MVYRAKHIRTNFHMGEMPVENIVYSRLGGCFVTFVQGTFFVVLILALASVACSITYYATNTSNQKSQHKTLSDFIDEKPTALEHVVLPLDVHSVEPKEYIVAIQPKLDEIDQPFTYTGAVYVTFVTHVDYVDSIQLQCNGVEPITVSNVRIFRMFERNDGPVKRAVDDSQSTAGEFDATTIIGNMNSSELEETTAAAAAVTTTTTTTSTTTSAPPLTTTVTEKENSNGYSSVLEVFSNYFLKYEDRHAEFLIRDVIPDRFNDTVTIRTRLSFRKDTLYVVKIEFNGDMTESGYGFLLSSYLDSTGTRKYFASTNTNSKLAHPIFPTIGYDRNLLIPFDIAILRRPHLTALANSKLTEKFVYRINGSEWTFTTFQTTAPMRVCDFNIVVTEIAPILITSAKLAVYAYIREKKAPNLAISDETLAKIIRTFENVTGIEYQTNRINLVGVPNNRQRRISPGMIVASENVFAKEVNGDRGHLYRIADIALLFAKLWYLPIVQYESDYDLWLNDAMPLYLQWHALQNIYGATNAMALAEYLWTRKLEGFEGDVDLVLIKSVVGQEKTDYLAKKIEKYTTDRRRGFYVLKMIEQIIGTDSFYRAIREHCANVIQRNESNLMELFQRKIFEKSVDISLTQVVNTWLQTDSYPIVTIDVETEKDEIIITQQPITSNDADTWQPFVLPLTIHSESDGSDEPMFVTTDTTVTIASDFIGNESMLLLNAGEFDYYYRTNYASNYWNQIADRLYENSTVFDELSLAELIDDAFKLARSNYLNYSVVFNLLNATISGDTHNLTLNSMRRNVKELLEVASDSCSTRVRVFVDDLISRTSTVKTEYLDTFNSSEFMRIIDTINFTHNDTDDIERALNSIDCTNDLNVSQAIWNLIFTAEMTTAMHSIIDTIGRCRITRKLALEKMYEELPRVLNVTAIEDWLPLFERISSEFEYKMLNDIYSKHSIYFQSKHRDDFKYIVAKIRVTLAWRRRVVDVCDSIDWNGFARS